MFKTRFSIACWILALVAIVIVALIAWRSIGNPESSTSVSAPTSPAVGVPAATQTTPPVDPEALRRIRLATAAYGVSEADTTLAEGEFQTRWIRLSPDWKELSRELESMLDSPSVSVFLGRSSQAARQKDFMERIRACRDAEKRLRATAASFPEMRKLLAGGYKPTDADINNIKEIRKALDTLSENIPVLRKESSRISTDAIRNRYP